MLFRLSRTLMISLGVLLSVFYLPAISFGQNLDEFRLQVGRFIEDHALEEALGLARVGLENYPGDPVLLVAAASLSANLGNTEQGERYLKTALSSPRFKSDLLLKVAGYYMKQARWGSAIGMLKRFVELEPGHPAGHYLLARALFFSGDDGSALEQALLAVELAPADSTFRRHAALLLDRAGRREEAFAQLRAAYRLAPDDARILLLLADKERQRKRWGRAMEYLELAASIDSENPLYRAQLAEVYESLGQSEQARLARSRAYELEEAFEIYRQALELRADHRNEEAIQILESAVKTNPGFSTGAVLLADLYREEGLYLQAGELYRRVLEADPGNTAIRDRSVRALLDSGRIGAALDVSMEAVEPSVNDKLLLGYERMLSDDWEGAVRYFKEVEREYPLHPQLLRQISLCLSSAGETEEALAYLRKAYRANPGNVAIEAQSRSTRFAYVQELEDEGSWEKALALLQQLNREDDESADYLFHMAYCLQKLQRYADAVQAYTEGLLYQPDSKWARINLAYCLYFLSRFDEASAQWEYLTAREDNPEYIYHLGTSRIREWRLNEGWSLIRRSAAAGYQPAIRLLERLDRKSGRPPARKPGRTVRN